MAGTEASVGIRAELDFAELLDDLLAASAGDDEDDDAIAPALRVDLLAQIERLGAQGRPVFAGQVAREYDDNAGSAAPKAAAAKPGSATTAATPKLQPALDDLFFLDPQSIARELGLEAKPSAEALDRARRNFALRYHPDRVPEAMRERAVLRMQIANMLIDEAKRRAR
jgi:hypothetical protein